MHNEKCIELIKLYENHRHLWDPTSPHHYNKQLKEDSWKIISKEMNLPISEVKKKITSLCGSFRREKSRHKKSLVTGSGRNEVYISKWFAYEHFYFLADKFSPRETQNSISIDTSSPSAARDTTNSEPSPSVSIWGQ
ncbi:hypothetical protein K1T71_014979 [Dendrolimus kikuchii]|nr:hypothetical protein K1T71_014979 [Dendrolimus kikuchii]